MATLAVLTCLDCLDRNWDGSQEVDQVGSAGFRFFICKHFAFLFIRVKVKHGCEE